MYWRDTPWREVAGGRLACM
jgi:hypothetical protein